MTKTASVFLQRKCACGGGAGLDGMCEACRDKRLQRRTSNFNEPFLGLPMMQEALRSPGQLRDEAMQTFMPPRFGHDFSKISVYPATPRIVQPKLKINQPGDEYEQEADRVAEQVLAAPAHTEVSGAAPHIQRYAGQPNGEAEMAPASVDRVLSSPGRPLDWTLQQNMEQRLGYDFSRVRVHSGAAVEQSAREVNAHAYTVGHDMVFGAGQFAPGTHEGQRLIAHELTHVVQQTGATHRPPAFAHLQTKAFTAERLNAPIIMRAPLDESPGGKRRFAVSLAKTPAPKVVRTKLGAQLTVYFGQNISSLNYESFAEVEKFAKEWGGLGEAMVFVEGFASTEGTDEHNLALSRKRREEVIAILSSKLSGETQFNGEGHGEKDAAVEETGSPGSEELEQQRSQNRRVQIWISRKKSEKPKRDFIDLTLSESQLEKFATPRRKVPCQPASFTGLYDSQPEALKAVIEASVGQAFCGKERDAAACFNFMNPKIKSAFIRIYNSLCEFGLWHHVQSVEKFAPGEKPVNLGLLKFEAPGLAENIHFFSYDTAALHSALRMHKNFCEDSGIGGVLHPGQSSIRQVNSPGGSSLHLALDKSEGAGMRFDAHIDRYSPVEKRLQSGACPEDIGIGTQMHWFRELFPEKVRSSPFFRLAVAAALYFFDSKVGGPLHSRISLGDWLIASLVSPVPGFQIFPEDPSRSAQDRLQLPPSSQRELQESMLFGITLSHDLFSGKASSGKSRQRLTPKAEDKRVSPPTEPKEAETFNKAARAIDEEVMKKVAPHALAPSEELGRLRLAEQTSEYALPEEEALATAGLRDAQMRVESYADPLPVAQELTRRMYEAHKNGRPVVELELGTQYKGLKGKQAIASTIERIALIIRARLPHRAEPVHSVWVYFGNKGGESRRGADEKVEINLTPIAAQPSEQEASTELEASEILELLKRNRFFIGP